MNRGNSHDRAREHTHATHVTFSMALPLTLENRVATARCYLMKKAKATNKKAKKSQMMKFITKQENTKFQINLN